MLSCCSRKVFILFQLFSNMVIGTALFVVLVLIIAIWAILEFKRFRHKVLAIFLIALVLFTYFSFTAVIKKNGVDVKTVSGLVEGSKLYFSWLGSIVVNVKDITTHAINMDWQSTNKTKTS